MVITRYNNKTYRIDDIAYDKNPSNTFEHGGVATSYIDYYKKQYNIEIRDLKQPLLISRKEVRISGESEKREYVFCLIPEICYMTGEFNPLSNSILFNIKGEFFLGQD